jgi:CBS domain-containing protein
MRVSELPPGRLLSVSPDTSLAQVAKRMRVDSSDSVAVMSAKKLVGIITERDLVRAIADGVDPQQARADMFMSADPATVGADEDLSVVAVKMMALGIRHLPVVDAKGAPVGLISAGDLVGMMEKGKHAG